jgi:hypothetical protein
VPSSSHGVGLREKKEEAIPVVAQNRHMLNDETLVKSPQNQSFNNFRWPCVRRTSRAK